jgi:hypothetical protein
MKPEQPEQLLLPLLIVLQGGDEPPSEEITTERMIRIRILGLVKEEHA